jgi:hypothetical protein
MGCGCKRLVKKAEKDGKVNEKKLKLISRLIVAPVITILMLILMPFLTVYLIYKMIFKDSKIIIPKKLAKYFQ